MKNSRKFLSVLLAVVAAVCLIAAVALSIRQLADHLRLQNAMESLSSSNDAAVQETPEGSPAPSPGPSESAREPIETPEPVPVPVVNPYRDSFLANRDMAAWIQIPGTVIDYPVMWTPANEEYYLRRGFGGNRDRNGCLILDTDSCLDPLTTNLIIHGHNMKSGAMFGTLTDYESEEFFQEHRSIFLYTQECQRCYEVIAVFRSQVYKKSQQVFKFYKFFQADTQEEFDDFYNNIMALALYDTGVSAAFGDRFLTLSTCSYHVEQGRFVVVARETEIGDTYLPLQE